MLINKIKSHFSLLKSELILIFCEDYLISFIKDDNIFHIFK
jgi:hypothetical protein